MNELTGDIRKGAEEAVDEELDATAADMAEHAPKDTLELVESITKERHGMTGVVYVKASHGWVPEYGTTTHEAEPYALPSAIAAQRRFPRRVRQKIGRRL
jgi:hypothetical protein